MTTLSDQERETLRAAAFGSLALVSKADPGFLSMFKESLAGSRALAAAPPEIRELFTGTGIPRPPTGSGEQIDAAVLGSVQEAVTLLRTKAPELLDGFRAVLLAACDEVAKASGGVAPTETAMIERIAAVLSGPPSDAPTTEVSPAPTTGVPPAPTAGSSDPPLGPSDEAEAAR